MTILLDENIPHLLKKLLSEFEVTTVQEIDLSETKNGALISFIDGTYDVFITADKNLKYQQNLATRRVAIVELYSNRLPEIERMKERIRTVLTTLAEGDFATIAPPEREAVSVQQVAAAWSKLGANYADSAPHKFGPSLPKLLELARPVKTDVCLDVGTGTGHTAAQLARFAKKVYGLDPAEGMRQAAQDIYGDLANLEFVHGTSEATGFSNDTFDIVTARHTLHHHPSMPRTLTESKRVLKRGGRLVIADEITPSAEVEAWYHALETTRDPTHGRAYLMSEWRAFIKEAGLKWIAGDVETVYTLNVESWITRMNPSHEQAQNVRRLFREADEAARETFNIVYEQGGAVTFDMPMALILAVKPEEEHD